MFEEKISSFSCLVHRYKRVSGLRLAVSGLKKKLVRIVIWGLKGFETRVKE